jgi:cytochrome b
MTLVSKLQPFYEGSLIQSVHNNLIQLTEVLVVVDGAILNQEVLASESGLVAFHSTSLLCEELLLAQIENMK